MELISRISPVVSFRGSVLMQLIVPRNFSFALIGKIAIKQSPILCIALFSVIYRYRGSDLTSSKIKYCPVSATLPVSPRPRRKALGRACISWIPAAAITLRTSFFGSKRKILTESKAKISVNFLYHLVQDRLDLQGLAGGGGHITKRREVAVARFELLA